MARWDTVKHDHTVRTSVLKSVLTLTAQTSVCVVMSQSRCGWNLFKVRGNVLMMSVIFSDNILTYPCFSGWYSLYHTHTRINVVLFSNHTHSSDIVNYPLTLNWSSVLLPISQWVNLICLQMRRYGCSGFCLASVRAVTKKYAMYFPHSMVLTSQTQRNAIKKGLWCSYLL